ncbi:MAG TPA: ATP-grasp domain-containing protein [Gemmatimonadales bacterium]|nr:ATP-grasp domain-containing protein [Gemmatimonadales bacterium]
MRDTRPLACVMGDMDLLRPLGLARIPCVVVAPPGAAPCFSRFTRATLPWVDTWDHPDEQVDTLVRFASAQPEPPVLFYQEDRELLLVSRYRERLRPAFRFAIGDATLVEDLVDKGRFQALAWRLDLPVPVARPLDLTRQPRPGDVDVPFPMVIKPLTRRTDRWTPLGGPGKALRVESLEVLQQLWPRVVVANVPLLAQQLVPGPETDVESYHVYVDESGEIVGEFTGRKIRTWPLELGHSTALVITDSPEVAELGRAVVRRLELRGVAKLDFKRGPKGRLYLLEINPRFTLWHHPAALAGVNVPALVYGDLAGLPRPAARRAHPGVRWCKIWHDAPAARSAGMPFLRWLPWALRCEAKSAFSWDDPLPLFGAAAWAAARRFAASLRALLPPAARPVKARLP